MINPSAWIAAHHKQLLIGGGAAATAAGGLAFARSRGDAARSSATAGTGSATPTSLAGLAGTSAADTSSTDVYNAIEPGIEANNALMQQIWDLLNGTKTTTPPKTTPVTPPTKKPTPVKKPPAKKTGPVAPKKPIKTPTRPVVTKPKTYVVRRGDTLTSIAAKFHVAGGYEALWKANKSQIKNPNVIHAGQVLRIP